MFRTIVAATRDRPRRATNTSISCRGLERSRGHPPRQSELTEASRWTGALMALAMMQ
jgi:hypothetical protein